MILLWTGFSIILWSSILLLTLLGTWLSLSLFKRPAPRRSRPFSRPGISILKPLKGIHEGLEENLESFFRIDYPNFEIFFSVADPNDPAAALVSRLQKQYPEIAAHLIAGDRKIGVNPKVNNLAVSYDTARNDLLMISDSNMRVDPDYLNAAVDVLGEKTGVVTGVVTGSEPLGIGGELEALHLNTFCTRGMMLASFVGRPCVLGKSMLIRRTTLERIGGIATLGRYLAEDYITAEVMHHLGLEVATMRTPVAQHIGRYSIKQFWTRHVRWGRIRKCHAPLVFLFEFFVSPVIAGLLGAAALARAFNLPFAEIFLFHLGICFIADAIILESMSQRLTWKTPLIWLLREVIWVPLWLAIAAGNRINWQGNHLHLEPGGLVTVSE